MARLATRFAHVSAALRRALVVVVAWSLTAALTTVAPMETTTGDNHPAVPVLLPLGPPKEPTRWRPLDFRTLTWPGPTRFDDAIRALRDSHIVDLCWLETLRQNPALRSSAARITFAVTAAGRLTDLDVVNSPDVRFTRCVRGSAGAIAPISEGGFMNAEMAVNLTVN